MQPRQAAPARASSPPAQPIRTRSKAASEAAAEGKEEKDDEGGGMDTAEDEDVKGSGPRREALACHSDLMTLPKSRRKKNSRGGGARR